MGFHLCELLFILNFFPDTFTMITVLNSLVSNLLHRPKTRIFWIILERLVSKRFLIDLRIIFENYFIPRAISHSIVIFKPQGVKSGSKGREGQISPFPIK